MLTNSFTVLNDLIKINHNHDDEEINYHIKDIVKDEDGGIFSSKGNDIHRIYNKEIHPESASDGARIIYDTIENWTYNVESYPGFSSLSCVNSVIIGRALMRLNYSMLDRGLYDYNLYSDSSFIVGDYAGDRSLHRTNLDLGDVQTTLDLYESRFKHAAWRKVKDYYVFVCSETIITSHVVVDSLVAEFNLSSLTVEHGGDVWDTVNILEKEKAYNVEVAVVHDLNLNIVGSALKYLS